MVKLVDTRGLGPRAERRGGSSPLPGTNYLVYSYLCRRLLKRVLLLTLFSGHFTFTLFSKIDFVYYYQLKRTRK